MSQIEVYTEVGELLRTAESVAELAGCQVATLDAYVSRGQMPAPLGEVGRTRLWSRAVVDNWLAVRSHDEVPAEEGQDEVPAVEGHDEVLVEEGEDQVPAELRELRRWTRHDHKRPIMTNGRPAAVMDPTTWTTYRKAKASTAGDGLGFVLVGDGIAGLDLNQCVIDGVLTPGARAILDLLPDTYAELSPSGTGVRLFCRAKVARGRRFTSHGVEMQICGSGRFLTVTGHRLPERPSVLEDHHAAVRSLLDNAHSSYPGTQATTSSRRQPVPQDCGVTRWGGGSLA